ncbi:MAG: hypothetical protein ACE5HF_11415 [Gemmatimonadota bacterium]
MGKTIQTAGRHVGELYELLKARERVSRGLSVTITDTFTDPGEDEPFPWRILIRLEPEPGQASAALELSPGGATVELRPNRAAREQGVEGIDDRIPVRLDHRLIFDNRGFADLQELASAIADYLHDGLELIRLRDR